MKLNAIQSLWNKACHTDGIDIFIEGLPPTAAENKAIDAEVIRLTAIQNVAQYNKPILEEISALDKKRIRPLAEGDTTYLNTLNQQIVALRSTLQ